MYNSYCPIPKAVNEPVLSYAPGSAEKASLKAELEKQSAEVIQIPLIIGGKEVYTEKKGKVVMPHDYGHVLAEYSLAGEKELKMAVDAAMEAKAEWEAMPFTHRAAIFLKAADLLSGPWRDKINASTMLGQSKTCYQAEIDAAAELCDFLRFDVQFAAELYKEQPLSVKNVWNRTEYRALDGFIMAISPFNFSSIGGNLAIAPAIMGNVVVWKPARTAALSNYYIYLLLKEAGLPDGVINFVPCSGRDASEFVLSDPRLGGFHFTGSSNTFNTIWADIGKNIANYEQYPRLVGETGGKDFIFAHPSANKDILIPAMIRGAFEYQGQKCSAASRAYIPRSIWQDIKKPLVDKTEAIRMGDPRDFRNFMTAVIDESAFDSIASYIDYARESDDAEVLCGSYDKSKGYFIRPTIIEAKDPHFKTMEEEIFGPVLTVYVYEDDELEEAVALCESTSPYALTGAIFAQDREAIIRLEKAFRHAAGNFYINDKPTGAVVGQQPFGGARASGTNDKAGSIFNMVRWTSPRVIKENFVPDTLVEYPFMKEE